MNLKEIWRKVWEKGRSVLNIIGESAGIYAATNDVIKNQRISEKVARLSKESDRQLFERTLFSLEAEEKNNVKKWLHEGQQCGKEDRASGRIGAYLASLPNDETREEYAKVLNAGTKKQFWDAVDRLDRDGVEQLVTRAILNTTDIVKYGAPIAKSAIVPAVRKGRKQIRKATRWLRQQRGATP